jgi:hypothetical protein
VEKSTININAISIIINLDFLSHAAESEMKTFKSLLALLGASSLLFGGEAFSFETRAGESGSRNASSLVEGREGTVRGRYRGYFASMPAGTYPKVNWELVKTKPSARTYYVPTQALAITVPLKAGTYNGHGLQFAIPIAANNAMVRMMARFDFDGSGTTDRMEMYYPTVVDGLAILTHATGLRVIAHMVIIQHKCRMVS